MFLHLSVILSQGEGGVHPLGKHPQQTHPVDRYLSPETATTMDGTHPTGMHCCLFYLWLIHTARYWIRYRERDWLNKKQECIPVG